MLFAINFSKDTFIIDNTNKNLLEDFVTKAKQSEANDDLGL